MRNANDSSCIAYGVSKREISLWLWEYTGDFGKRWRSTWCMTEESAKRYRDAVKIDGTLEVRKPRPLGAYFRPQGAGGK